MGVEEGEEEMERNKITGPTGSSKDEFPNVVRDIVCKLKNSKPLRKNHTEARRETTNITKQNMKVAKT